ncbi:hypothetical protein GGI04_003481 [Coemansia thaxteri]|nr:hypothetical protein GGI04_003481 [Coemansia thaxteri]
MDDYQEANPGHGAERSHNAAPSHPRYTKQPHYASDAVAYSHPHASSSAHAQNTLVMGASSHQPAVSSMPPAGYEWSGYSAQTQAQTLAQTQAMAQNVPMHGAQGRAASHAPTHRASTTQPLRIKVSERLQQIDRETYENEEREYQEKGEEIQNDLAMILRGTHPVFVEGAARLAAERDRALESAEQNHQYLVAMYKRVYTQEREQAEQAFKAEKQIIYDRIAADIDDRRKRLKEDKDSQDISMDFVFESGSRTSSKRNLRKRGGLDSLSLLGAEPAASRHQSKRKTAQAFSMQGIAENDIISDLLAIRRATGVTGPLTTATNGKKNTKTSKR